MSTPQMPSDGLPPLPGDQPQQQPPQPAAPPPQHYPTQPAVTEPVVQFGPPTAPPPGQPPMPMGYGPPPPRPKAPLVLAGVLAAALLVAMGVFVAWQVTSDDAAEPAAERMPASVSAYASIDLGSGDQASNVLRIAQAFDYGGDSDDPADLIDDMLGAMDADGLDAAADLDEWVGTNAAVAMWADSTGQPFALIGVDSTDDSAAEEGLADLADVSGADDRMAYEVSGGFAMIAVGDGDAQQALDNATAEADGSSLANSDSFGDARDWLSEDQLAVIWLDMAALGETMSMLADADPDFAGFDDAYADMGGSMIAGVRATDEGIEARVRLYDSDVPAYGSTDLLDRFGQLPAGEMALMASLPEDLESWLPIEDLAGMIAEEESGYGGWGDPAQALTDAEYTEYEQLQSEYYAGEDADWTQEQRDRYTELDDRYWQHGRQSDYPGYGTGPTPDELADTVLQALAGATISVVMSDLTSDSPAVQLDAELGVDADSLLADIPELTEEFDGTVDTDGSNLSISTGTLPDGRLADDPTFQQAMEDAPSEANVALYLDFDAIIPEEDEDSMGALRALGLVSGTEDGDPTGLMRVLIDDE